MALLGRRHLRNFKARPKIIYDTYFDFSKNKMVPNFRIPPLGRNIRVTDLKGNPIVLSHRRVQGGKFRVVYKKIDYQSQREAAFRLLDSCFSILRFYLIF